MSIQQKTFYLTVSLNKDWVEVSNSGLKDLDALLTQGWKVINSISPNVSMTSPHSHMVASPIIYILEKTA